MFVLSHYPHPTIEFANGTTFHFVDGAPAEALQRAQEAARRSRRPDRRRASTVRQFLKAGLVDFMHLVIVPITLGRGVSLWDGTTGAEADFTLESISSPSGLTHQLWNRIEPGSRVGLR